MKILFYQWDAFMQNDMELALTNMGIEYNVYRYPKKDKSDFDAFKAEIDREISIDTYDAVFSFNYRSEIALSAYEAGIPYIAWIVDSPFGITQDENILRLNTNYLFVFDGRDYHLLKDRGIGTVYHQAVAVNVERLGSIQLSEEDHRRFDADVSFVGSLYPTNYASFRNRLDEEETAFLESVMNRQMDVQGEYMLDVLTDDELMLEKLQCSSEGTYSGYDILFHEGLQSILAKEITRRERMMMLMYLSEFNQVALYSKRSDPLLKKVEDRGTVDNFTELPKVYSASRINLNITYRRMAKGVPLRVLEIMGAGGFVLSNYQEELALEFEPGVDLVMYDSIEDAGEKVDYYLRHEEERARIAANGHEKVKEFTYEKQFKKILDIVRG